MPTGAKVVEPYYQREMLESTGPNIRWLFQRLSFRILRPSSCNTSDCLHVECADKPEKQSWHLLPDGHGPFQRGLYDRAYRLSPETCIGRCHLERYRFNNLGFAGSVGRHYNGLHTDLKAAFQPDQTWLVG